MVASKLDPAILYKETDDIDDEDLEFDSSLYDITLKKLNLNLTIALGKQKMTYIKRNVIYFPIYLIYDDKVIKKIGVFEILDKFLSTILDEDEDVDISKINSDPLLFENSTKAKLEKYNNIPDTEETSDEINEAVDNDENKDADENESEDADDDDEDDEEKEPDTDEGADENDETEDNKDDIDINKTKIQIDTEKKVFDKVPNYKEREPLVQEDDAMAQKEKSVYKKKIKTTWIEEFMNNNNYDIIDNEGGGDCFFLAIQEAFLGAGLRTSVQKLRKLLADNVEESTYENYVEHYNMYDSAIKNDVKEINELKEEVKKLKKVCSTTTDVKSKKSCTENIETKVATIEKLLTEKDISGELLEEYAFLKNVTSFDKFKKVITTCKFWADTFAISTIERLLNTKIIILSSEAYEQDDKDNVVHCGQLNDNILQQKGIMTPDHYIILEYTGMHYKLITYKEREIFTFKELPHDLKKLILIKCLESSDGPYSIIPDFKNMKEKIVKSTPKPPVELIDTNDAKLFDANIVFQIYAKSNDKPLPGKGNGEKIPQEDVIHFSELANNENKNWRRKLSNQHISPFLLKGNNWNSVEHYYQANKYKNNEEIYKQFTLESKSSISQDPVKAKEAGMKPSYFAKSTKVDPEFAKNAKTYLEEGLEAKFTQHEDLKKMLLETKTAKITQYTRANEPIVLTELMELRNKLK